MKINHSFIQQLVFTLEFSLFTFISGGGMSDTRTTVEISSQW